MLRFNCDCCLLPVDASHTMVSLVVKCPSCGTQLRVPKPRVRLTFLQCLWQSICLFVSTCFAMIAIMLFLRSLSYLH